MQIFPPHALCPVCNYPRGNNRNHSKCSKILQKQHREANEQRGNQNAVQEPEGQEDTEEPTSR